MSVEASLAADGLVQVEDHTGILLMRLTDPPANALTLRLRRALMTALKRAASDPGIGALVLIGRPEAFLRSLEYGELGQPQDAPDLADLCAQIEAMPMPVLCCLSGAVQGAGLELALSAHYRVASNDAVLSFPDIRLGLGPTGGASQRLPRLVGAPIAIDILCDGKQITAPDALQTGLIDQIWRRGLEAQALSMAHELRQKHPRHSGQRADGLIIARDRMDGLRDPGGFFRAVEAARGRHRDRRRSHVLAVLDCIEAAQILSFDQGLGFEETQGCDLARAAPTRARLHGFACERAVLAPPRVLSGQKMGRIARLLVRGGNLGNAGPIRLALSAGLTVEVDTPTLSDFNALRQEIVALHGQQSTTDVTLEADLARLLRADAGSIERAEVVLCDGRSTAEPATLGRPVVLLGGGRNGLPDEVVFWPGTKPGQVIDLCAGPQSSPATQAAGYSLARSFGFQVHLQGPGHPLSQRLRRCLGAVFELLTGDGHSRQTVAQAMGAIGIGIGAEMDLPDAPEGGAEIQRMALAALANEGARCLEDGVAGLPRDVDAAALFHGILPTWMGGPMYQADLVGVMAMRRRLQQMTDRAPSLFAPSPLWDGLVAEGLSLGDLNRERVSRARDR